jgi:uncharacterized protein (TIGR03435 family)
MVVCGAVSSQSFEVATIKPSDPESLGRWIRMQSANQFAARNHTLKTLIAAAYNLHPHAISGGPAWIDSERYDIVARTPGAERPSLDEQMAMLRTLLAERFGLRFHRERKELSIYALTVAKGGPKLRAPAPVTNPEGAPALVFVLSPQGASMPGHSATMAEVASVLQRAALDRPVVDQTGLSERYDFDLKFLPDETQFGGINRWDQNQEDRWPDLFAAVQQQLGLRLQAGRGPVETLVIDRAERPSAN